MSSNVRIQLTKSLPEAFLSAPSVAVGGGAEQQSTPDAYGCVEKDGQPLLSIAVRSRSDECRAFEEATIWGGKVVVGFGHSLHLVDLGRRQSVSHELGSYFGSLHAEAEWLLVMSAQRIVRIGSKGTVVWTSARVGIDGVLVSEVVDGVIHGQGEWDPPGGWRPFQLRLADGKANRAGRR